MDTRDYVKREGPEWLALRMLTAYKQKFGGAPETYTSTYELGSGRPIHTMYVESGKCVEWCEGCIEEAGGVDG